MKKLHDSDWLRAVQFKCNTSAKSVTLKDKRKFSKPMILRKMMTKNLCGNFEKKFSRMRKNGFKKGLPVLAPRKVFHVYIINK